MAQVIVWAQEQPRWRHRRKNPRWGQSLHRLVIELSSTFRIRIFRLHLGMYLSGYKAMHNQYS